MPWWLYGIIANSGIVFVEAINRSNYFGSFIGTLPYTIGFIAFTQWGLYKSWSMAPTMMTAWVFFAVGNSAFRLLSNKFLVNEPTNWKHVALVLCMFVCAYLMKIVK